MTIDDLNKIEKEEKGMKEGYSYTAIDKVFGQIEEFERQQRENTAKTLSEIITKYDFIVGSKESMYRLLEILPEGAKVIFTPYIDDPTKIFAIKKFDIMDLCRPAESEDKE